MNAMSPMQLYNFNETTLR